jgi:hypothetical protein
MSPDMVVPIIASIAWLVLAGSALASFRLGWSKMVKMALAWLVIFLGLFLLVEWFQAAQDSASSLV